MRSLATACLALALLAAWPAAAQVDVPPTPGALNNAVNNNTTPGQVFRLQSGQTYLLTDRMEPTVDVVIEADGGDCPVVPADCPLIQPIDPGGGPERIMQIETAGVSATLRGVAATMRSPSGTRDERMFRLRADGVSLTLDRTYLYDEATMIVRVDNSAPNIYAYDSVIKDVGDINGNLDEGRFIDDRGSDMGEVVVTGCTFYNIVNRVIRDDGGDLQRLRFEHNTLNYVRRRAVEAGDVEEALVQNLMLVNVGFQGADAGEINSMISLDSTGTGTENHLVRNVNFYVDPSIIENPDGEIQLLNSVARDANDGFEETLLEEVVTFADGPTAFFDFAGEPFDFSYAGSFDSFSASTGGQPLGALIWFGLEVDAEDGAAPTGFAFAGAAPNPFAARTALAFTLDRAADVRLDVFDLLGRRVATLAEGPHAAGTHTATFDARALPAGVYLARLSADGQTATRKLTLLR
ncbi:MAG: T9SS type A sorting domain-containing protein [Bacteroidota bacterium]